MQTGRRGGQVCKLKRKGEMKEERMSCHSLDLLCSVTKKALNCHSGHFQLAAIEMYNSQPQLQL